MQSMRIVDLWKSLEPAAPQHSLTNQLTQGVLRVPVYA